MNKEEILAKSREENKDRDEMELDTQAKAGRAAVAAGGIVCMIIILAEWLLGGHFGFAIWAVYLSMSGTMLLTKYRRLHKKHELYAGGFQVAMAAAFLAAHIISLMR